MPTPSLNIHGSFTAPGVSDTDKNERAADDDFNVQISGTWVGTIKFQRDFSKATGESEVWNTINIFTGTGVPDVDFVSKNGMNAGGNVRYRFEATVISSGEAFFIANQ